MEVVMIAVLHTWLNSKLGGYRATMRRTMPGCLVWYSDMQELYMGDQAINYLITARKSCQGTIRSESPT